MITETGVKKVLMPTPGCFPKSFSWTKLSNNLCTNHLTYVFANKVRNVCMQIFNLHTWVFKRIKLTCEIVLSKITQKIKYVVRKRPLCSFIVLLHSVQHDIKNFGFKMFRPSCWYSILWHFKVMWNCAIVFAFRPKKFWNNPPKFF